MTKDKTPKSLDEAELDGAQAGSGHIEVYEVSFGTRIGTEGSARKTVTAGPTASLRAKDDTDRS